MRRLLVVPLLLSGACRVAVEADEDLSDALVTAFSSVEADDAELAAVLRNVEEQLYRTVTVAETAVADRSVTPRRLTAADVVVSPHPDVDPADALAVSTAWLSPAEFDQHARIPLVADQAAAKLEPASPDTFDRTFTEGEDCWQDRGCLWLRTDNDVVKKNILLTIPNELLKNYRWIDLNAGTNDPERWGYVATSWAPDSYSSENGQNTIVQSYTVEAWFPRDGQGFLWSDVPNDELPSDPTQTASDSSGGGTLRTLTLWTQTELSIPADENTETGTIRWGIDQIFHAHDAWIEANPE